MTGFERTEWIARAPEAVFAFLADASNAPRVMPQIRQMVKLTDGPVAAGTRYRETRMVNGKEAAADLEVARFEPPQRYAMRNVSEGIETVYHYSFTPEGDGTRVDLLCELHAGGLRKVMLPLVAAVLRKEDGDHLHRLKAALEA
jgi:uncharacterized protein YndB with AHSA1/START domain